jgi:hypothetical protein
VNELGPPRGFWRTLAAKVGPAEASLVALGGIFWFVVWRSLPKISDLVAIVLLLLVGLLTFVILRMMRERTPLLRQQRLEGNQTTSNDLPDYLEVPSQEAYRKTLSQRGSPNEGVDD